MTTSLRKLLRKGIAFEWLPEHQKDFNLVNKLLVSEAVVQYFDVTKDTEILTDASRKQGLGFALMQRDATGRRRMIQCGSRLITKAEENLATVELEAKAIEFTIIKYRHYLIFTVLIDHRPLTSIFTKRMDETTNTRLLRIREKLSNFWLEVKWEPGKTNLIADALSRAPVFAPPEDEEEDDHTMVRQADVEDPRILLLNEAA